ncbi:MAG: alpha/beta hydrolase [Treponema sp.]|nr:alpha/beta hydrolase [Treponema sp.]
MAFSNNRRAAIKRLRLLVPSPRVEIAHFRERLDAEYAVSVLPNRVDYRTCDYGGVPCDMLSPEIYSSKRVVLYVHGGAFVGGSRVAYREFCSLLAHKSFSRVVVPEFRLMPEHPLPDAMDDIRSVFRTLYTEEQVACLLAAEPGAGGSDAWPEFIIAADGSGATIALSFVRSLDAKYRERITRIVLLSPWLNFSPDSLALSAKKKSDDVISTEMLKRCLGYTGWENDAGRAALSIVAATDRELRGFPAVYMQLGGKELLLPDAVQFAERLRQTGGTGTLETVPDMPPLFQFADDYLWEAHDAIDRLGAVVAGTDGTHRCVLIQNKPILEHSRWSEA